MKSCFFIGHREADERLLPTLVNAIERLIVSEDVTCFYVGGYGGFDRITATAVKQVKQRYPEITLMLVLIANSHHAKTIEEYEHIDFISTITPADCFACAEQGPYWGEDNVGIINLNNFELLYLPINRYGDHRELVEEPAGVMLSCGIMDEKADTYAHAYVFPDNAYATLQITGVQYAIDRDLIQNRLCQTCLDSINNLWFTTQPPVEYAVISFENRTIQPLLNAHPWFAAGNYGIDCEFKEEGEIDLLVHYCPNRYE